MWRAPSASRDKRSTDTFPEPRRCSWPAQCAPPTASWPVWQLDLDGITDPVVAVTEGIAFALEQLSSDNQVEFVFNQRRGGRQTVSIVSDTALSFGRSMLHRFDVDWAQHGFDEAGLDELAEFCLRVQHSFLADPGRPPRSGADLRRYLTRWIGPAIAYPLMARAMDALKSPEPPRARRRPSAAS